MRKRLFCLAILILPLAGCLGPNISQDPAIRKVAVVSLAISNWRGINVIGLFGGEAGLRLVQHGADELLQITEESLAKRWEVLPVRSFYNSPHYLDLAEDAAFRVITPTFDDQPLPTFSPTTGELLKGNTEPARARALCAALKVDAVVLVFSDWTVRTGAFSNTTKAVTKNVVAIWDAQGEKRVFKRVDRMGRRSIGNQLMYELSDETLSEWTSTYRESLEEILEGV